MELEAGEDEETNDDKKIFGKDGAVRGWNWLDVYDGQLAGSDSDSESELEKDELKKEPNEAVMGNEVQATTGGLGGESRL